MEDTSKKHSGNQSNNDQKAGSGEKGNANLADAIGGDDVLSGEVEKLQTDLAEQKEKYLRLYAEFDNYKRRNAKERVELIQTAGRDVIVSLLDVLDDCDRAEKQIQESGESNAVTEGVQLVFNKLRNTMMSKGLKVMETKGQEFNPDEQEAISQIPVTDAALKGKVIDEVVKGYILNDKIIRFAKVVVGS